MASYKPYRGLENYESVDSAEDFYDKLVEVNNAAALSGIKALVDFMIFAEGIDVVRDETVMEAARVIGGILKVVDRSKERSMSYLGALLDGFVEEDIVLLLATIYRVRNDLFVDKVLEDRDKLLSYPERLKVIEIEFYLSVLVTCSVTSERLVLLKNLIDKFFEVNKVNVIDFNGNYSAYFASSFVRENLGFNISTNPFGATRIGKVRIA